MPDIVAIARALVLALFPMLAEAMRRGRTARQACDDAWALHGARWRAEHGPAVAIEAAATLDAVGAADVLIKSGVAAWVARGPIAPLPPPPGKAIPPPVESIPWWRRLWPPRHGTG